MNIEKFLFEDYFSGKDVLFSFNYTDPEINSIEHNHEFLELVIVDKGYGVHIFNGRSYFIQEGDVFFIREIDRHYYNELGTLKLINLHINHHYEFKFLTRIDKLLSYLYLKNHEIWLSPNRKKSCVNLILQVTELNQLSDVETRYFKSESLFMQLLGEILFTEEKLHGVAYKIRKLMTYLQENYPNKIDWDLLAEQFFLTNKTMTRKIKELTGLSPVNYLNRLRMLNARDKVRHTDQAIIEIAYQCGFNNSDYFTRCYKKNFSLLPSEERKLYK